MLKNVNLTNYNPTQSEIEKIKKKLKVDKLSSLIFAIIWNVMVLLTLFKLIQAIDFSNMVSYVAIGALSIFVFSGIYLIFDAIKKCTIKVDKLHFSSGYMLKTWTERSGCSDSKTTNYYTNIELANGEILEKVEIDFELWRYALSNVVIAIKKDKIICIVLKDAKFS